MKPRFQSATAMALLMFFPLTFSHASSVTIKHRVKFGETLWEISRRYNVSPQQIMRANHMTPRDYLVIGQTLIIPHPDPSAGDRGKAIEGRKVKTSYLPTSVIRAIGGKLRLTSPLPRGARVTSPFGWRIHPITRRREFHKGVDLAARIGTPVRAAAAGKVTFAGRLGGYGLTVIIEHKGGISTLYGHLSVISVSPGERVEGGERIGFSGNSGLSTGPHLHFEVRVKDEPVDPKRFVRF